VWLLNCGPDYHLLLHFGQNRLDEDTNVIDNTELFPKKAAKKRKSVRPSDEPSLSTGGSEVQEDKPARQLPVPHIVRRRGESFEWSEPDYAQSRHWFNRLHQRYSTAAQAGCILCALVFLYQIIYILGMWQFNYQAVP
jgi:hypothetical protein